MDSCCQKKGSELAVLHQRHGHVLKIVLAINLIMFFVEFAYGWIANSTALMGDSLDMLGDATVYAFSLYVLHKDAKWKTSAAFVKGVLIAAFGIWVFVEAIKKVFSSTIPTFETMGIVAALALAANVSCLFLLYKYKEDDLNMKSTFICSRNDIVSNCGVLLAAAGVAWTQSKWPDIAIGLVISFLFLKSSIPILRESLLALKIKAAN